MQGGIYLLMNTWFNLVVIYLLIIKSCTDEKKILSVIVMIVAGITYLSYYSLNNVYLNYGTPDFRAAGFGWYENRNDLVLILTIVLPLAMSVVEITKNSFLRFIFFATEIMFTINILFAGSRQGLIGLALVGGASILFLKKLPRVIRFSLLTVLIVSILGIGLATVLTRSRFRRAPFWRMLPQRIALYNGKHVSE